MESIDRTEMRLGLAAWQPYMRPYCTYECILLYLKDVRTLCEPPPGDTQVRGQLLVMTREETSLPARMAVFLRAEEYVLELPQIELKRSYEIHHLKRDRADFTAIPIWVEFYGWHGYRPRWHRTGDGSLVDFVRARMTSADVPGQQLERMSLKRLRKILGVDVVGTDGAAGFDGEGQIRRR
jgi:hypothetical protein